MIHQIQSWLIEQLSGVDTVRSAKANPAEANRAEAETLIVQTWSGVLMHVYIAHEPLKVRTIKRMISDNTRVGVGTLFIVNAEHVPADGEQVEPEEWLLAIHALFRDKIYTYRLVNGEPRIGQVHFKAYSRGDMREVWYGPDVKIQHLPSLRVWVSAPQSIKGNWLIASFGSEAFWKNADYSAGRNAFRQQQRRASSSPRFFEWSNPPWNTSGGHEGYRTPASPLPESALDRAYRQLGLPRGASGDEVKAAFRRLAREVHPDVSALPKPEAEAKFKKLHEAYIMIKETNGW